LLHYQWPGNIRELENAIERALVLGSTEIIFPEDLPESILEAAPSTETPTTTYHDLVREAKRRIIFDALEKTGGNYTDAAHRLGVHTNNLHRLIRDLDLRTVTKELMGRMQG
jgi:Nif-specific regulatory protein